jgi:hypothetical protein
LARLRRGRQLILDLLELILQLGNPLLEPRFQLRDRNGAVRGQGDLTSLKLLEHRLQLGNLLLQ